MDPSSQSDTNLFEKIPQHIIMQNLTHFFLSPTVKAIPYVDYFVKHERWPIYSLAFIHSFARSNNHTKIIQDILIRLLPNKQQDLQFKQILKQIINFQQSSLNATLTRKILIARLISLPSMMAENLSKNKINIAEIQKTIIQEICQILQEISSEEQIFLVNKIVLLGYSNSLLKNRGAIEIGKIYEFIVKKQSILNSLLDILFDTSSSQDIQKYKTILDSLIQFHQKTNNLQVFSKLFNNQSFLPSQAQQIYDFVFSDHPNICVYVFENLLLWWVQGNDYYLIYNNIKLKTNIFALCLKSFNQDQVYSYSSKVSLGIQRRLLMANANRKQVVELVWGVLADKIDFKMTKQFKFNLLVNDKKIETIKQEMKKVEKQQNEELHNVADENCQKSDDQNEQTVHENESDQIIIKPPKNLYDCILGLRNPLRKKMTLKLLPNIIRRNPEDLVFTWNGIFNELLYDLSNETGPSVLALFSMRPQTFIESLGEIFFTKNHSLNDKIQIMQILKNGVQQLSKKPILVINQKPKQQFYFKKVTSRYLTQEDAKKKQQQNFLEVKDESRSKRWGYTRIAYENRMKEKQSGSVSLKIVGNQPYINRLYQIANQLFFRIISKLSLLSIFPSEPMFTTPMLKLLGTLSQNLKNHIEKYKILVQIVDICLFVIEYVEKQNKKNGKMEQRQSYLKKWKQTNISVVDTLMKISYVIDKYLPQRMLLNLQKCVIKIKSSPEYGLGPIINMIEANIYTNYSGEKVNF